MRKRNMSYKADLIFWYFIYFFPAIIYMLYIISGNFTDISFSTFFANIGFSFATNNFLVAIFRDMFGASGILPLFSTDTVYIIFVWFISTMLCHLVVDFILFIPRLAHSFMDKFCKGE